MTQAKLDELTKELEKLMQIRPRAMAEVSRLAEMGDFSENAAYQHAKGRLRGINQRILEVEDHIKHAKIISSTHNSQTVQLGSKVVIDIQGKQQTFQVLGPTETDPLKKIISYKSPLGAQLMGKRAGEKFTLQIAGKGAEVKVVRIFS